MTEHIAVGPAVREARRARSISLRQLAARLAVSPATLSAIETGRTPLTVERLQHIATLLDVPAPMLLRGQPGVVPEQVPRKHRDWRTFEDITTTPVLDAATAVFVRLGFHAASMRTVAAEAGLSVAGVYHHHRSKQHLLEAILTITMHEIQWRIEAARDDGTSLIDSYAQMIEALALFHAVRGDLAFLGASEMRGLTGAAHARVVAMRDHVQYTIDDVADRCLAAGEFSCSDPRIVGRAIVTMCTSLPSWYNPDGPLSPQNIAHRYARLALTLMGSPA